ncbi:MAG: AAA family ATPase [Sulfurimonadaceae bacterium]|nr:AAA family ATPase [Sulfurimonadaceae bacterium]
MSKIDFSDITRDDIVKAIAKYNGLEENGQLSDNRKAKDYLLFYNSKDYPHKYIVGIAYGLKHNQETLDSKFYNSTGNHKSSAQWCMEKNGFILYAAKKFKDYLGTKYDNQTTINTYYSDLKKAIKIFQNIERLKGKNLNEIFEEMKSDSINYEEYDKSQKELGFNDKQLFSTLKTKVKVYLESIQNETLYNGEEDVPKSTQKQALNQILNQILYGSPGTGKTYNTINKALEIVDSKFYEENKNNREKLKEKFEEYKKAGQIEFITFHQSYGYEEFVEGIKAKTKDENISYDVEGGIFKKLSKKALENFENSKKTVKQLSQEKTQKQKLEIFLNDSFEDEKEFSKTKGGKFKIKEMNEQNIILFTEDSSYSDKKVVLDIDEFLKIINFESEFKNSKQLAKEVFGINNQRQKDTYYLSMYNEFRKINFDYIEDTEYTTELKNYILIIDEINRGNISKIFGELVTLIEDSKRVGSDEEIKVKLPYSGELFGVPQNLYILGTMNTADRSIALLDTALRRRFHFLEMMPNPELLKDIEVEGINIKNLLETINKRVEYLYDKDHTIGHAYFMSLKENPTLYELENIFRNKIIPLLQEYFYDDWEKIRVVLGDGFVEKEVVNPDIFDEDSEYLEDEKYNYIIKQEFDFERFR